jgi:hypothetical protein
MRYEFYVYDNKWMIDCAELMELLLGHGTKMVNYYLIVEPKLLLSIFDITKNQENKKNRKRK